MRQHDDHLRALRAKLRDIALRRLRGGGHFKLRKRGGFHHIGCILGRQPEDPDLYAAALQEHIGLRAGNGLACPFAHIGAEDREWARRDALLQKRSSAVEFVVSEDHRVGPIALHRAHQRKPTPVIGAERVACVQQERALRVVRAQTLDLRVEGAEADVLARFADATGKVCMAEKCQFDLVHTLIPSVRRAKRP